MDFAIPTDYRVEIKGNEKRDKYLDLVRELKKLWNIKMMVIPIIINVLGIIPKGLVRGLEKLEIGGQVETTQTTVLLGLVRIQSNISHLFTQFNEQTVLFQTIQFSISHLFALSLNIKHFYLTHRWDIIRHYHSRPEWTGQKIFGKSMLLYRNDYSNIKPLA